MTVSAADTSPPGPDHAIADDWRGLGDLIALTVEHLTVPVEGMHRAIADRWFGLAGQQAAPAARTYQAFTAGVYGSVRTGAAVIGTAVGWGAALVGTRSDLPRLWRSAPGRGVQSVVNAQWGDALEARKSHFAIEMAVRDASGAPIGTDPPSLARAFPAPSGRLVVLLHGLGETEHCWDRGSDGARSDLTEVLAAEGLTPLRLRYNTGRHISDNGVSLAALLEEVVRGWPVDVEEVAIVGHSMGGLVARSSIHAGRAAGHVWPATVGRLVAVGSPHLGSPIEKGVNLASWALRLVPESRPLSDFIDLRSAGIKDLRFGAVREADWTGVAPDVLLRDIVDDVPLPEGVHQFFVAGVLTADPAHPIGALAGDLIVRVGSGTGRGRRRRLEATDVRVFGGRRHFDLLHDLDVHLEVRDWLVP